MTTESSENTLFHLKDQPDAEEEVLVVDFDNLAVVNAVVSNVNEWGCRLTSVDVQELYKNIGIRAKDAGKLLKAHVTSVKGNDAAVVFAKQEKLGADKRREKRNDVKIPVKIADLDGITEIEGTIVDAGKNGCRVKAKGLTALPEEVLLTMNKFDRPVVAEFAWRNESSAGMRLLWNRTLEQDDSTAGGASDDADMSSEDDPMQTATEF
ncbi:PilZ domain-containing protein [Roseibium porphyridii]|uniref:PilZ domain-containing protein n=1 Tax=Roseibium porphyridii TaxID=2866279 RepID=A0ABY8F8H6_9HYPH|nr:PilZ domain-containing protein [Roseibium sp. KMA01]WFE91808.1 PilZ domain-containing protein [Roseibium sp. KMA01]